MRLTDEQIGAELTALRETPSEKFAAELDAWAAEGFPSAKELKSTEPRKSASFWSQKRPLLAAAACAVLVVSVTAAAIAGYLGGANNDGADSATPLSSNEVEGSAKAPAGTAATGTATADLFSKQASPPRNNRPQIQELSASLGLSTDADKIQEAADGVVEVTGRFEGFVDSSDVHVGDSEGHARFMLRIPAAHLRDALDDLSDLGRVTLRDEGSANVTGAYVDSGKRYRDARAKVDSLLEELGNASSPSEADAIRQQLETARQELAASRAALGGVKQRVTYAPVSVEITAEGDGSWSIGDAADDAVGVLEAIGGALLIALAVLVPLAALIALGWFGTRELSRRRREATLDRS
jgi:hypothetical protein